MPGHTGWCPVSKLDLSRQNRMTGCLRDHVRCHSCGNVVNSHGVTERRYCLCRILYLDPPSEAPRVAEGVSFQFVNATSGEIGMVMRVLPKGDKEQSLSIHDLLGLRRAVSSELSQMSENNIMAHHGGGIVRTIAERELGDTVRAADEVRRVLSIPGSEELCREMLAEAKAGVSPEGKRAYSELLKLAGIGMSTRKTDDEPD